MKKILVALLISFFSLTLVKAECSYTDKAQYNTQAGKVKASYEIISETQEYDDGTSTIEYFKITILNVTENIYVEITNNVNSDLATFHYSDSEDGIITYLWYENEQVTNFSIKVYAESNTGCGGELLKTTRLSTPKYNDYYNRAICADMPDFYLCQKYININNVDESMFNKRVESFMSGKIDDEGNKIDDNKKTNKILEFLKKYKWYMIGVLLVIIALASYNIVNNSKKQRKRLK